MRILMITYIYSLSQDTTLIHSEDLTCQQILIHQTQPQILVFDSNSCNIVQIHLEIAQIWSYRKKAHH